MNRMRYLVLAGLVLCVVAYLLPRETRHLALADGDRDRVDERLVLRLSRFSIPTYPSGKPRQYVSETRWSDGETGVWQEATISVNHPLRAQGWWIYQMDYAKDELGRLVTQLHCVREPFFPLAVAGWLLTILGAAGMCFSFRPPPSSGEIGRVRRFVSWACALAVIALPVFIIGRVVLRPDPFPALQSPLMAPHVAAYAASYLIVLFAAFGLGRRFLAFGFLLMTSGLVLGAWWGKMVWGAWWQNDPKEVWSLATWLVFLGYFFLHERPKAELSLRILTAVLVILTLTWVNFSRIFAGLHSYARLLDC